MTWYEFFAGGGMARLGLGDAWECLFANEWSEKKAAAYRARFGGDELRVCDVASLRTSDLRGHADLAWASFPARPWRDPTPPGRRRATGRRPGHGRDSE